VVQVNACIRTLDLADNSIQDGGGVAIAELLKSNATVTELDLTANALRTPACTALAAVLRPKVGKLRKLLLKQNNLGDRECCALVDGLSNNTTLAILDLSCNQIGPRGAAALGAAISENATLEVRFASGIWVAKSAGSKLSSCLGDTTQHTQRAQEMNLSWNPFRPKGSAAIAKGVTPQLLTYHGVASEMTAPARWASAARPTRC
jgi:Ran GTPase-activating protein (RanGAP) involved in mRNA processing and transport